ncbi:MAG: hypothetical protein D3904_01465 [Candidatus Electrothrix sp. EH2]|nr:hypothetical protein [Candidatus Electrothrix sp. EH2]
MLNIKDHKTINMFDPFDYLGPKRRKMPDESWAGIFREPVRHILQVDLLTRYFSPGMGRPTNELVAMTGAIGLYDDIFEAAGDELMKTFDADPSPQRIDSVHIFSNMKHPGRIGIFTRAVQF